MAQHPSKQELTQWIERFRQGDRRALARLITCLDNGWDVEEVLDKTADAARALKVGLTGPGGAGKSTMSAALLQHLRSIGKKVAVLACDPASPFTGGALLGDRVRMDYEPDDAAAFFRSLSSRGATGGLSDSAAAIVQLTERFGFDVVIVETVGTGQDQMAVRELVDVLVLVVTPASGDEIQWEKAGLLEAADLVVVNKADLPGADAAVAGLRSMLELAQSTSEVPILKVVANKPTGMDSLWEAISQQATQAPPHRHIAAPNRLLSAIQRRMALRFHALASEEENDVQQIISKFAAGELEEDNASRQLIRILLDADAIVKRN